jgi:hypothetical protein
MWPSGLQFITVLPSSASQAYPSHECYTSKCLKEYEVNFLRMKVLMEEIVFYANRGI